MPTFNGTRATLLVLYPWGGHLMSDWAMATGAAGTGANRWAQGGATNATWTAAEGHVTGNYAARFNPAAATCFIIGESYAPTTWIPRDTALTPYLVARVKCKSGAAGSFVLRAQYYNAVPTLLGTDTYTLTPGTGDLAADNTWRVTRSAGTIPSGTTQVKLTAGFIAGTPTADVYVDWFTFAYMTAGSEMGPTNFGVSALHPKNYDYTAPQSRRRSPAGNHAHRRARARLREGEIETNAIAAADIAKWQTMKDYAHSAPVTLFYRQDTGRDYAEKVWLDADEGLDPVIGISTFTARTGWVEAP